MQAAGEQSQLVQWALTAASSLAVAVLTAILTVRLSLRRFYSERWWDRKAQSYSSVLEALFHLQQYSNAFYDSLLEHSSIPDDRDRELQEKWRRASEEIERAMAIGSFVMSQAAMRVLEEYRQARRSDPNDDLLEEVERNVEALKACIPAFLAAAKQDLRVKSAT